MNSQGQTINAYSDTEYRKIRKRDRFLQKLIDQNVSSKTGLLQTKLLNEEMSQGILQLPALQKDGMPQPSLVLASDNESSNIAGRLSIQHQPGNLFLRQPAEFSSNTIGASHRNTNGNMNMTNDGIGSNDSANRRGRGPAYNSHNDKFSLMRQSQVANAQTRFLMNQSHIANNSLYDTSSVQTMFQQNSLLKTQAFLPQQKQSSQDPKSRVIHFKGPGMVISPSKKDREEQLSPNFVTDRSILGVSPNSIIDTVPALQQKRVFDAQMQKSYQQIKLTQGHLVMNSTDLHEIIVKDSKRSQDSHRGDNSTNLKGDSIHKIDGARLTSHADVGHTHYSVMKASKASGMSEILSPNDDGQNFQIGQNNLQHPGSQLRTGSSGFYSKNDPESLQNSPEIIAKLLNKSPDLHNDSETTRTKLPSLIRMSHQNSKNLIDEKFEDLLNSQRKKNDKGMLNMSIQIEQRNLSKFKRQVDDVFVHKRQSRIRRANYSIDVTLKHSNRRHDDLEFQKPSFGKDSLFDAHGDSSVQRSPDLSIKPKIPLELAAFKDSEARFTEKRRSSVFSGSGNRLPSIKSNRPSIDGNQKNLKSFKVSVTNDMELISKREKQYQRKVLRGEIEALRASLLNPLEEPDKNIKNPFVLQSHHYKPNRVKDGGWGERVSTGSTTEERKFVRRTQISPREGEPLTTETILLQNQIKVEKSHMDILREARSDGNPVFDSKDLDTIEKNKEMTQKLKEALASNSKSKDAKRKRKGKAATLKKEGKKETLEKAYNIFQPIQKAGIQVKATISARPMQQQQLNHQNTIPLSNTMRTHHRLTNQSQISVNTEATFVNNQKSQLHQSNMNSQMGIVTHDSSKKTRGNPPVQSIDVFQNMQAITSSPHPPTNTIRLPQLNKVKLIGPLNKKEKEAPLDLDKMNHVVLTSPASLSQSHLDNGMMKINDNLKAQLGQQISSQVINQGQSTHMSKNFNDTSSMVFHSNSSKYQFGVTSTAAVILTAPPNRGSMKVVEEKKEQPTESYPKIQKYLSQQQRTLKNINSSMCPSAEQLTFLNREKEREERKYFFDQFDKIASQKINVQSQEFSPEKLDPKLVVRRQREQIMKQIKETQKLIKERKKQIDEQKSKNSLIFQRYTRTLEMSKSIQAMASQPGSQATFSQKNLSFSALEEGLASDYQNTINPQTINVNQGPGGEVFSKDFIMKENSSDPQFKPDLHLASNGSIQQLSPMKGGASSHRGAQDEIRGFYKLLFEQDLKNARERTLVQLESLKELNEVSHMESHELSEENAKLKAIIGNYKKMIQQIQNKKRGISEPKYEFFQPNKDDGLSLDLINQQLYRYGENGKDNRNETRSSFYGNQTSNTPATTTFNYRTHRSFHGGRAPGFLDIKKAELITLHLPTILRQTKVLDALVNQMTMVKQVFKAQKATLFVIDGDLQKNLFQSKTERRQNYKKLMVGGSGVVYAVFAQENDFAGPYFRDVSEAHTTVFNNKVMYVPYKLQGKTQLSLQLIFDEKMKVGRFENTRTTGFAPRMTTKSMRMSSVRKPRSTIKGGGSPLKESSTGSRSNNQRTSVPPVSMPGWTQLDYNLLRILAGFIFSNVDFYSALVIQKAKLQKMYDVIDFAMDIMKVKTYRQLVKALKGYSEDLLGFDYCTLFFLNDNSGQLFTVADQELHQSEEKQSSVISFAKELYFPEDQVVIFPTSIGITGEVFNRGSLRFENDFGQLISKKTLDDDDEDGRSSRTQSQLGAKNVKNYVLSLINQKSAPKQAPLDSRILKTKLERIKEHAPAAEHEAINAMVKDMDMQSSGLPRQSQFSPFKGGPMSDQDSSVSTPALKLMNADASRNQTFNEDFSYRKKSSKNVSNIAQQIDPNIAKVLEQENQYPRTPRKLKTQKSRGISQELLKESDLQGNIMDLAPSLGNRERRPTKKFKEKEDKFYTQFVSDIDNFAGVKKINNYVICAIKDDGYGISKDPVGVLQLHNRIEGRKVSKEDLARLECIANFAGALSKKCQAIVSCLMLIIGMTQNIGPPDQALRGIDTQPGIGVFQNLSLPIDCIIKQLSLEHQQAGGEGGQGEEQPAEKKRKQQ